MFFQTNKILPVLSIFLFSIATFLYGNEPDAAIASPLLQRDLLLQYQKQNGQLECVQTTQQWSQRRKFILTAMQSIMGPLPGNEKRCDLNIKIIEEKDCGTYIRKLISYASEPGARVPAYLLIPKNALKKNSSAAAVLCLHPTDDKIGHKVVVGLGGRANRQYAQELPELGFVTLAPAYPLLADYQPDWKKLGYQSGTMKAIWDNMRGVDLLMSLPYVKKEGVAAIGHSLGGHNAVYTAVFDQRIKVIVSSCGLDSYADYKNGDLTGWTGDRYMPKLLKYKNRLSQIPFDFHEMIGTLAPRSCFISAPLHDANFKWKSVDRIVHAAKPVYKLYGSQNNLQVVHPNCPHDFPEEVRKKRTNSLRID